MTSREVRAKRAARIAPLAGLAGQTSGETVAVALARKRRQAGDAEPYAQLLDRFTGVAVKAGQLLWTATAGAVMPAATLKAFQRALTGFTEDAPIMPPELTARTVRAELGRPPQDVFAEFDPTPFATGPICQVHAAVLHDGRRVAVKIRYWGAAQALRTALAGDEVRAALGPLVQAVAPGTTTTGLQATAGELRGRVEESIGLRAEAADQAEFAAAYQEHPFVRIPYVVPELSTQRVLTMERVDGIGWAEALRSGGAAKDRWGEAIYRFRAGSARGLGKAGADPGGQGNHVFHDDGAVTFLGFQGVRRLGPEEVTALRDQTRAVVAQGADGLSELHRQQCGSVPNPDPERLSTWHREMTRPLTGPQPFTCTPAWADAVAEAGLPANWPCGATAQPPPAGPGCLFTIDADTGTASLLGALGATADWHAIRREWDCGGPPATPLGKLESAWTAARTGETDVH
jgi:predicted unusual protein kinase regulating ubiquinone biosynthesis (AarF/ABC1/UbiB family)